MAEHKKLKQISKGVCEDTFQNIVVRAPTSVASLTELGRSLQEQDLCRARNTRARLPQASLALASPDLLSSSLNIEALQTIIHNFSSKSWPILGSQRNPQ